MLYAALVDFSLRSDERADVLIDRLNEQSIYVIVISGHDALPMAARRAAAILQKPFSLGPLLSSLRPVVARNLERNAARRDSKTLGELLARVRDELGEQTSPDLLNAIAAALQ